MINLYKLILVLFLILSTNIYCYASSIDHFTNSIAYRNQATRIINKGKAFESVSQNDSAKFLNLYKKALAEAKEVNIDELNRKYDQLGNNYKNLFLRGLELDIEGLEKGIPDKSIQGQTLIDQFGAWYSQNVSGIKKALGR